MEQLCQIRLPRRRKVCKNATGLAKHVCCFNGLGNRLRELCFLCARERLDPGKAISSDGRFVHLRSWLGAIRSLGPRNKALQLGNAFLVRRVGKHDKNNKTWLLAVNGPMRVAVARAVPASISLSRTTKAKFARLEPAHRGSFSPKCRASYDQRRKAHVYLRA